MANDRDAGGGSGRRVPERDRGAVTDRRVGGRARARSGWDRADPGDALGRTSLVDRRVAEPRRR